MSAPGTIYFIGEKDLRTGEISSFYKVGIVRENQNNLERDADERLAEHQTENLRELFVDHTILPPFAERIETLVYKKFASWGVRVEWMSLEADQLEKVKAATSLFAKETVEVAEDEDLASQLADTPSSELILQSTDETLSLQIRYLQESSKLKQCETVRQSLKRLIEVPHKEEPATVDQFAEVREQKGRSKFDNDGFRVKYHEIYQKFVQLMRKPSRLLPANRLEFVFNMVSLILLDLKGVRIGHIIIS